MIQFCRVADYDNYPDDSQVIQLSVESYGFQASALNITFTVENTTFYGAPVMAPLTVTSGPTDDDQFSQLWSFTGFWIGVTNQNTFPRATAYINIARRSAGVVYRLALPIMLLLLLGKGCIACVE